MNNFTLSNEQLEELYQISKGHSLDWLRTGIQGTFPNASFLENKEIFLSALLSLLKSGKLKLAKSGAFLSGDIEEQVKHFHDSWPESEEYDKANPDLDFYWWFFDEKCPGGAVWVNDDGTLEWT